jgi:uncharacterized membrane protein (DUF485 family)
MASEQTQRILKNPNYQQLVKSRNALSWVLTIVVLIAYYGFTLAVAFDKTLFSAPLASGMVTTWWIPVGIGIIVLTIVLTAVYVRKANSEYDRTLAKVIDEEVQS